jgi:hypothetical protein
LIRLAAIAVAAPLFSNGTASLFSDVIGASESVAKLTDPLA